MLAVAGSQLEEATSLMDEAFLESLSEKEKEISRIVVDHNASHIQCPGCLAEFASGPDECPECGLFLGVP